MSGNSILKNGALMKEKYGTDLDKLVEGDYVGLMRTSDVSFSHPRVYLVDLKILLLYLFCFC